MNKHRLVFGGFVMGLISLLVQSVAVVADQAPKETAIDETNFKNFHALSPLISTAGLVESAGLAELKSLGYRYVIDLRLPEEGIEEERAEVKKLGMTYVNIPVGKIWPEDALLEQFASILNSKESKPILIHCASGNRAGMIWSYYQITSGTNVDRALSEGRKIGMKPRWEAALRNRFSIVD